MTRTRSGIHALLPALGLMFTTATLATAAVLPSYTIRDVLNRTWGSERVTYPIEVGQAAELSGRTRLVDSRGTEVPWQLAADGKSLTFQATVPPLGEQTYRFQEGKPTAATDLSVRETPEVIEIVNGRTGVRVNRALAGGAGPLAGWRLASGAWGGGSRLNLEREIADYTVSVVAKGPVVVTVEARAHFEDGGSWSVTVELEAGEPLFKVREAFDVEPAAGRLTLLLDGGMVPASILYRAAGQYDYRGGRTSLGQLVAQDLPLNRASSLFLLEPWVHWQSSMNRGTWFALVNAEGPDAFFMGTGDSPCWVDPSLPAAARARPNTTVRRTAAGEISVDFFLKRGEREYFLGTFTTAELVADLHGKTPAPRQTAQKDVFADQLTAEQEALLAKLRKAPNLLDGVGTRLGRAPLPHQFLIKHSDFPLDRVKDMVLDWESTPTQHPRLLVSPGQLAAFRKSHKVSDRTLAEARRSLVNVHYLEKLLPTYLATGDPQVEQRLIDGALALLQGATSGFVTMANDNESLGVAPHHRRSIVSIVNLVDAILSSDQLTDAQRLRIRGQLAFLGYLFNSPAYWSPPRGYAAMFVNMHTTVAALQCAIAGILPDHPEAKAWMGRGMGYMRHNLLDRWIDEDGHWSGTSVEAPHYGMSSYDDVLGAMIMAERVGLSDDLYGDAMKLTGAWFAKISTPPDPRIKGWRHLPPIGNTYKFEPSGIFGILATVYREQDPDFSAEMQWMQQQQGNPTSPGVGGFAAALAGYRRVLMDPALPARVPRWGSEWFRETGAVLRSQYGTDEETMLYMIAGVGASPVRHWDHDQGALTIWGRGVPICDDFGYTGCAPAEDQTLLTSPVARGTMVVQALEKADAFDYLQGRQGAWLRQIMLVKRPPALPGAPEYFVIHDSLDKPAAAVWRMWLTARPITMGSGQALIFGKKGGGDTSTGGLLDAALEDDGEDSLLGDVGESAPKPGDDYSIGVGVRDVVVNSHAGRQTDIWFAQLPPGSAIQTELKTRSPAGVNGEGRYLGQVPSTQGGLILESRAFGSLLTLVFPRLTEEAPPKVTTIAGGRGFRVEHATGTDHVFLSEKPVSFDEAGVAFDRAVGVVRRMGQDVVRGARP